MKCNCSVGNIVLAAIIILFAFLDRPISKGIIISAGILLVIHSIWHNHSCEVGTSKGVKMPIPLKAVKKAGGKKRRR